MSDQDAALPARSLPERPNLEHLKKQARRALQALRTRGADARLADAQLAVARDYGFASWRALKACVESRALRPAAPHANLTGFYRHDPAVMANAVAGIAAAGDALELRAVNGATFTLMPDGEGRFSLPGTEGWFSFEGGADGPATALISHSPAGTARLERIDDAGARAIIERRRLAEEEQARPRTLIAVAPERLARLIGHYLLPNGPALEISLRAGRLLAQVSGQPAVEIFPESETEFFYLVLPAQLSFEMQGDAAMAVILHQNGLDQRMVRVSAEEAERAAGTISRRLAEQQQPRTRVAIEPASLARCVGRYRLDPARVLDVTAEDARLFIAITDQPRLEVYPEAETTFFWTVVAAQISFVIPPGRSRASHAVLHQNGRDFPLPRIDDDGGPDA